MPFEKTRTYLPLAEIAGVTARLPRQQEYLDSVDGVAAHQSAVRIIGELESQVVELMAALREIAAAIRTHRAQKADDRCIEDDDRLYEALGDGIKCDRRVGNKDEMLANCARFIEHRCESGGWKTYRELEEENELLKEGTVNGMMPYELSAVEMNRVEKDIVEAESIATRRGAGGVGYVMIESRTARALFEMASSGKGKQHASMPRAATIKDAADAQQSRIARKANGAT
jgi:hypothetical protein